MVNKTRCFSQEVGPSPVVFVATEAGVLKETSGHFQSWLCATKTDILNKPWCFPNPDIVDFVPKPKQSISIATWQEIPKIPPEQTCSITNFGHQAKKKKKKSCDFNFVERKVETISFHRTLQLSLVIELSYCEYKSNWNPVCSPEAAHDSDQTPSCNCFTVSQRTP